MEETEIELTVPITVKFYANKAERMTRHYPGCPANIEIEDVILPDVAWVVCTYEDEIKEACWDHINEYEAENAMMQAEYRRDAREDR